MRTRSFGRVPTGRGFVNWLAEMSPRRGFVKWLAAETRLTRRRLAQLARAEEVPGVERAANGYNFNWGGDPRELAAWISKRKRFRKGNRKRPPKRNRKLSELQQLVRAIRRLNKLARSDAVWSDIKRTPKEQLHNIKNLLAQIVGFYDAVRRQIGKKEYGSYF